MPWSIRSRWSTAICSHRVESAYPKPFMAVSGERMSCAAAAITVSSATRLPSRCWRAHSNRHTVAAAARFRDSARPGVGTRTGTSASAAVSEGRPQASLPNRKTVGWVRSRWYRSASPSAAIAKTRHPRSRRAAVTSAVSTSRTRGTWNRDPAEARTVFGLYASTEEVENTTASAPAPSAERSTVPAFPGSRTAWSTATHLGASSASSARSTKEATPTRPTGVPERLPYRLGALDEERPVALAEGALLQLDRGGDLGVADRREHGSLRPGSPS